MAITKINSLGVNLSSPLTFSAGTVSLPSITFSGDTNTGVFAPAADTIGFTEGGAERMRISTSGDGEVLFGTTARPSSSVGGSAFVQDDSDRDVLYMSSTSTGSKSLAAFFNPNGVVGTISTNASATAYNTSSDYRLKENVTYDFDATTRLKQLKPARFNFKADANRTVDGFLAHEVQEIIPEAIHGTKDQIDSEGKPIHQGIDQSKIVPLLTGALQEAIAKIEQLEARLTALESK